eukprot:ctg_698.g348
MRRRRPYFGTTPLRRLPDPRHRHPSTPAYPLAELAADPVAPGPLAPTHSIAPCRRPAHSGRPPAVRRRPPSSAPAAGHTTPAARAQTPRTSPGYCASGAWPPARGAPGAPACQSRESTPPAAAIEFGCVQCYLGRVRTPIRACSGGTWSSPPLGAVASRSPVARPPASWTGAGRGAPCSPPCPDRTAKPIDAAAHTSASARKSCHRGRRETAR